jgi:hypothetical protein
MQQSKVTFSKELQHAGPFETETATEKNQEAS